MKHRVFFLLRLFCCRHVMGVSRFSAVSTTWFTVASTFVRFVTLLVAFKALLVFIPALIGIVKLASTTKTFSSCIWLLRIPWWQFRFLRWVLGHAVNLLFFRVPRALEFPFCRSRVFLSAVSIAVVNSIAFLNSN